MTAQQQYLLDANVFIEAHRRFYAFDIAPSFWEALVKHASEGRLLSIDRVRAELERGKDELATWAEQRFHSWFASTQEADVLESYGIAMRWAQTQVKYTNVAKAEFADSQNADAWLIAYARANDCILVTLETPDPKRRNKIKIPDACQALGVAFIDIFAMLRALKVRL